MHVVIVGAGPSGLLCAINLLRRNEPSSPPMYTVELVEASEDYGLLAKDGLSKKRSSMSALAVSAPLAMYLHDNFKNSAHLTRRYGLRLNFVDAEQRRVHLRAADGTETYLSYDLLVGADGVGSRVRSALFANHRDSESSVKDLFESFKSIHIKTPEGVAPNFMHVFPSCLRNMNGIGLAQTGDRMSISLGHRWHQPCDEALLSSDASVVAQYLKEHFKAFPLPYEEFSQAWVNTEWQCCTTTHCNYFHSEKLQLVIMGDAARFTSTSIGMRVNHACGGASALNELLDTHGNELASFLPMNSMLHVQEDRAHTDMADLMQSCDSRRSLRLTLRRMGRTIGNKVMPSVVHPPAIRMKLSDMGRFSALRDKMSAMTQRHIEDASDLIHPPSVRRSGINRAFGCWV